MVASGMQRWAIIEGAAEAEPEQPLPHVEWAAYQRQLVDAFLISRQATSAQATVRNSLSALRANFLPWLEGRGRYVWEVSPDDMDAWALSLKHSVKTRTHRQYFAQVQQFYEWLVVRRADELHRRLGVQARNPVDRFNRARRLPEDERLVPVPREEAIAFFLAASRAAIAAAPSDVKWLGICRNYALWMLLNWAGLRRMEAVALEREDVDLVGGVLRVRAGKGGKGRLVQIQPPLAPALRWYLHEVRPQYSCSWRQAAVFLGAAQRPLHPDGLRNLLHAQQVAVRLPEEDQFTCHGFRRAYATRLYKALRAQGFRDPLVYVKEQLGHEYLSTTQRYCQLDDDYRYGLVREATGALVRHYGDGGKEGGT